MKITQEMIEVGAREIRRVMVEAARKLDDGLIVVDWPQLPEMAKNEYRSMAESALKAALGE